jgi:hypothetical protein
MLGVLPIGKLGGARAHQFLQRRVLCVEPSREDPAAAFEDIVAA